MYKHSTSILLSIFSLFLFSCDTGVPLGGLASQLNDFSIQNDNLSGQSCLLKEKNQRIVNAFSRNYLFNDEIEIPADYQVLNSLDLVKALRVSEKEEYSFWVENADAYDQSFSHGVSDGLFGFRPLFLGTTTQDTSDDRFTMYVVEINSPAYNAGLRRGDTILSIDGVTSGEIYSQVYALDDNAFFTYYVELVGLDHSKDELTIVWQSTGDAQMHEATIARDSYTSDVVETNKIFENGEEKVGYLAYRSFSDFSSTRLVESFDYFDDQGADSLILDFRSNGGGLVSLAAFITNSSLNEGNHLSDSVLLNYEYNDLRSDQNRSFNFSDDEYNIGATKVAVLIDSGSCSASELVINMLKPYADVTIIGDEASCGKPYGMEPTPICDSYLFPVTLQFTNALNEADYIHGFEPDCEVEDTLAYNWGDANDPQIDEALHILNGGTCRFVPEVAQSVATKSLQSRTLDKSTIRSASTYEDYENPIAPLFK